MPNVRSTTKFDAVIGSRLRARRLEMKLSQADLAEAVGISFQQVQKYEKGTNRLGSVRLLEFAKLLETDANYFLDGFTQGRGKLAVNRFADFLSTKVGADINDAMLDLDEGHRLVVISLARSLAKL